MGKKAARRMMDLAERDGQIRSAFAAGMPVSGEAAASEPKADGAPIGKKTARPAKAAKGKAEETRPAASAKPAPSPKPKNGQADSADMPQEGGAMPRPGPDFDALAANLGR